MELTSDNLKLEDELERIVNSDIDIDIKIYKAKDLLARMVTIDGSIAKFTSMMTNNNNNLNPQNNGTD